MSINKFDQLSSDICKLIFERTKNNEFVMEELINCFLNAGYEVFSQLAQSRDVFEQFLLKVVEWLFIAMEQYDTVKIKDDKDEF